MSLIPTPLPLVGEKVTALQNALSALGFAFPANELRSPPPDNGLYGPITRAAVEAFRQRLGLPTLPPNVPSFDAAAARLLNVIVPANGSASGPLSAAVRESLAAAQGAAPVEVEWLARYATIARDFTAARQAAALAPDDAFIINVIQPLVG